MAKRPAATKLAHIEHLLTREGEASMRLIGVVLFCHLLIEQVLYELLRLGADRQEVALTAPENLTFERKVARCQATTIQVDGPPILTKDLAAALLGLNGLRNALAHTYGAEPTYEELHAVVRAFERAGVEFTDNMTDCPAVAQSYGYDSETLIREAAGHVFFDLAILLQEAGGPDLIG